MNFASLLFWKIFLLGIAIVFLLKLHPRLRSAKVFDRIFLCLLSSAFFLAESPMSFAIFVYVAGFTLVAIRILERRPDMGRMGKGFFLAVVVTFQVLPLLYFKYAQLLIPDLAVEQPRWFSVGALIPIGISFYTFQKIAFLIDHLRAGQERISALDYFNFASFFPQIVAGPIERKQDLLPQMRVFRFEFQLERFANGLRWIVLGLFYKLVLANNLSGSTDWISGKVDNPWLVHAANTAFGLRIYFDFAGYSFIALGLAQILGVKLTPNFNAPYLKPDIQDFWRSWHRTLTNWFRDYLYIPLGGNKSKYRIGIVILVFIISGIWHGAGGNFVLWGLMHGFMLAFLIKKPAWMKLPNTAAWLLTLTLVSYSWMFFYQTDFSLLLEKVKLTLSPSAYSIRPDSGVAAIIGSPGNQLYFWGSFFAAIGAISIEWFSWRRRGNPYSLFQTAPIQAGLVFLMIWLSPVSDNGFIYFNF